MEFNKKTFRNLFLGVVGCIVLYWLLHETERVKGAWAAIQGLISPFVVGAALAFILNVPMRAIEKLLRGIKRPGIRRTLSVLLTFIAIILVIVLVFVLLVPPLEETIMSLVSALPGFFERIWEICMIFLEDHPEILRWLMDNTELENLDWAQIVSNVASIAGNSLTTIFNGLISAVGSVAGAVVDAVIALVFAIYCLCRKEILARQCRRLLYSLVPERISDQVVRILRMTNSTFSNFISGQCLEAVILGGLFAIAMAIFKMPYIPLVSVLVSVTALVPVVGAFVGCILGAFFILVSNPLQAVWFVVMFLVLQQIENNVIYPRVVGTSIGLPGMWVLVAVTIGGDLMGVGGMLMMIPVASVLYALLREFTDKRLAERNIAEDKLQDRPPELRSKFKEKRQNAKAKRQKRKLELHLKKNQKK